MKENRAERMPQQVFKLHGITYVPHYRNRNIFVGPGYPRFTQQIYSVTDLVNAGAKEETDFLWTRSEHGVVNATHL